MNIEFKYQSDYDKLSEACPPLYFEPLILNPIYRWVFEDIGNSNNFESQYHRKPNRFLQAKEKNKCKAMGLSFFTDEDSALKKYNELLICIGPNVTKTLGSNIAIGHLLETDGVNGDFDKVGHFTHHCSSTSNYMERFSILKSLI